MDTRLQGKLKSQTAGKEKWREAISYIQENYYAKDLNMAMVSNHICMNYSLFFQQRLKNIPV